MSRRVKGRRLEGSILLLLDGLHGNGRRRRLDDWSDSDGRRRRKLGFDASRRSGGDRCCRDRSWCLSLSLSGRRSSSRRVSSEVGSPVGWLFGIGFSIPIVDERRRIL